MILLALLLLEAVTSVELVDETYAIPADDWRYAPLGLEQRPARVMARFDVTPPSQRARLLLIRLDQLEHLQTGQPHEDLATTPYLSRGSLTYNIPAAGDYVIVVDNRGQPAAQVHLRVRLDFPAVTRLSREKQLTVILISFAAFFAIVTYSARRLLRVIKR